MALAALFCQFPSFLDQYVTRLSGHVGELTLVTEQIKQLASNGNKSMEQYLEKFSSSPDIDFKSQGVFVQNIIDRKNLLQHTYSNLITAPIWKKPFVFISSLDGSIAEQTINSFKASLVLSLESFVYAFLGILTGICLFKLASSVVARLRHVLMVDPHPS